MNRAVEVVVMIDGEDVLAGTLRTVEEPSIRSTFRYDDAYLSHPKAYALEPELPLQDSSHTFRDGLPLSFQDASPDAWGQNLLTLERKAANLEGAGLPPYPNAVDHLLGVSDATRQGALRFRVEGGPYLLDAPDVPKTVALSDLLADADAIVEESPSQWKAAVKRMLDAGTGALGGALPKAAVNDGDALWLAKFPMLTDKVDRSAWEKVALDLAERAGLEVPERRLVRIGGRSLLLIKRFDRVDGTRLGYISTRTLVAEHRDGGAGEYTDMAASLRAFSSDPRTDVARLFRQVVLGAAINNTDNHLRNHGLLHESGRWRFSPVFDMNPNPDLGAYRATGIGGSLLPMNTARGIADLARACGLKAAATEAIVTDVREAVDGWQDVAEANGVGHEISKFADTFDGMARELAGA